MATIFVERQREALLRRMADLTAESWPRWGSLDAARMLSHLDLCTRMALGDLVVPPAGTRLFTMFPLKQFVLRVLPFPRGAQTAVELVGQVPESLDGVRKDVIARMRLLARGPAHGDGPVHPLFGPLSREEWGRLVHKHANHHLRQFGV
jgi:hypothetical protein